MGASKQQAAPNRNRTARLLVLGDRQVGKSAAIVRYTTGRFIQEYSGATNNWLYRHSLAARTRRNSTQTVELIEQRDIRLPGVAGQQQQQQQQAQTQTQTQQHQQTSACLAATGSGGQSSARALAHRAAQDQRLDLERGERQSMLDKLEWAHAYVVVYAINNAASFNKAIRYLNFIDNHLNAAGGASSGLRGSPLAGSVGSGTSSSASASSSSGNASASSSGGTGSSSGGRQQQCACTRPHAIKRPVLLLANKRDLERSARQVSTGDGRLLAMRHQSMFAEVSVAETHKLIESCLLNLVEQIEPARLHSGSLAPARGAGGKAPAPLCAGGSSTLSSWSLEAALCRTGNSLTAPVWANLIRDPAVPVLQPNSVALSGPVGAHRKPQTVASLSRRADGVQRQPAAAAAAKQPRWSSGSSSSELSVALQAAGAPTEASRGRKERYQEKYEHLKLSFKRASMAIVSSKALVKQAPVAKVCQSSSSESAAVSGSFRAQYQAGFCEPISEHKASNWLKSHIGSGRHKPVHDDGQTADRRAGKPQRNLFRYRDRRKTVALEGEQLKRLEAADRAADNLSLDNYTPCGRDTAKSMYSCATNSASSSRDTPPSKCSSLATLKEICNNHELVEEEKEKDEDEDEDEENLSPAVAVSANRNNAFIRTRLDIVLSYGEGDGGAPLTRTLTSEASTSGASYEDSSDDPMKLAPTSSVVGREPVMQRQRQQTAHVPETMGHVKKRCQLVKSMQNTLSSLTKSSTGQARRSFCNTLFTHSNSARAASAKRISEPSIGIAKTEDIRETVPTMLGYCS